MRYYFLITALITLLFPYNVILAQSEEPSCGLMVMAHGGTDEWNEAVQTAVNPLKEELPTTIAFGMADPTTLQEAVDELEKEVDCIAVVRLFVSGNSFLHQTEYLLGLRSDPPRGFLLHGHHGQPRVVTDSSEMPPPLNVAADIEINQEGLMDSPAMGSILASRALEISDRSGNESVLVIAHGPGDDAENERWIRNLDGLADSIRVKGAFESVEVHTLREDWRQKRAIAEEEIRGFVEAANAKDHRVLVIPFRLYGFGPYKKVLDGLTYEASGKGLLPSPEITNWIRDQMEKILADRISEQS